MKNILINEGYTWAEPLVSTVTIPIGIEGSFPAETAFAPSKAFGGFRLLLAASKRPRRLLLLFKHSRFLAILRVETAVFSPLLLPPLPNLPFLPLAFSQQNRCREEGGPQFSQHVRLQNSRLKKPSMGLLSLLVSPGAKATLTMHGFMYRFSGTLVTCRSG